MWGFVAVYQGLRLSPSVGNQVAFKVTADFASPEDDPYVVATCDWNGKDLVLRAEAPDEDAWTLILEHFGKCVEASCGIVVGAGIYLESVKEVHENV